MPITHFAPGEIWPDNNGVHINAHGGGILLHKGVYYWFGEHKVAGELGNSAQVGVSCYASTDLLNWKDEGIALEVSDDPASDITRGCVLERPKVIYNAATRKFVMWFHLELRGQGYKAARCGVAVADAPAGPFRFIESFRPNAGIGFVAATAAQCAPLSAEEATALENPDHDWKEWFSARSDLIYRRDFAGGQMARDMTLFVDDDGAAYHFYASEENATLQISQLTDDYLRPAGIYSRNFPGRSHEAPAPFKHDGKYFMFSSDCTGWTPNPARLSTADSILGPWTELGNPCIGTPEQMATTFESQSTHVLPVAGKPGAFIYMGDRWRPQNAIDGRHVWLPVEWNDGIPQLRWHDEWNLDFFDSEN